MKNWLLAEFGIVGPRHRCGAADVRLLREFLRQIGLVGAAGAIAAAAVAALRHEAGDHAVERDAVVKAFVRQFGDALDMLRRQVVAQRDDDIAAVERQGQFFGRIGHVLAP